MTTPEPQQPAVPACGITWPGYPNSEPSDVSIPCDRDRGHDGEHRSTEYHVPPWPGCTCELVDVSLRYGKPEYMLGDPKGCPVHDSAKQVSARAEAAHQARYGVAQPAPTGEAS